MKVIQCHECDNKKFGLMNGTDKTFIINIAFTTVIVTAQRSRDPILTSDFKPELFDARP